MKLRTGQARGTIDRQRKVLLLLLLLGLVDGVQHARRSRAMGPGASVGSSRSSLWTLPGR